MKKVICVNNEDDRVCLLGIGEVFNVFRVEEKTIRVWIGRNVYQYPLSNFVEYREIFSPEELNYLENGKGLYIECNKDALMVMLGGRIIYYNTFDSVDYSVLKALGFYFDKIKITSVEDILGLLEEKEWVSGERNYYLVLDKKWDKWESHYATWLYSHRERYVTKESLERVVNLLNKKILK